MFQQWEIDTFFIVSTAVIVILGCRMALFLHLLKLVYNNIGFTDTKVYQSIKKID